MVIRPDMIVSHFVPNS